MHRNRIDSAQQLFRFGLENRSTVTRSEAPSLNLCVRELDKGSWVIVELPGYTSAATGTSETSLEALRSAGHTSYYKGDGSLWAKLVSDGGGARPGRGGGTGASLQVSR